MANGPVYGTKVTIERAGKGMKLKIWGARALYANVNKPRRDKAGNPEKYDCEFLVPKGAEGVDAVIAEIRKFGNEQFPGTKWKCPAVSDPDREIAEAKSMGQEIQQHLAMKAGHWLFKANANLEYAPAVSGEIYSGCYAGAVIGISKYDYTDKTGARAFGVKGYLNGVQFQGDGERLGGGTTNLESEFGATPAPSMPDNDFTAGMPEYDQKPSNDDGDLPF